MLASKERHISFDVLGNAHHRFGGADPFSAFPTFHHLGNLIQHHGVIYRIISFCK